MASSPPPPTVSETGPLDRLQRAVAGWVGPAVYALPILEVWLLSRMGDRGADALLVVLQVCWAVCFAGVLLICARRWRAPGSERGPITAVTDTFGVGRQCVSASGWHAEAHVAPALPPAPADAHVRRHTSAPPTRRRVTPRARPRRRGDH